MYNQKKTLAFQVFFQGREYRIYAEGAVEGFKEIIEAPRELQNNSDLVIVNRYPVLLAQERVALSLSINRSPLTIGTNSAKSGASQETAENILQKTSECAFDSL